MDTYQIQEPLTLIHRLETLVDRTPRLIPRVVFALLESIEVKECSIVGSSDP